MANDTKIDNDNLGLDHNRDEHIANINGKPSAWTFEEIIDLEIHSKTSSLSESCTTDGCHQDLIEAATVPPKLAFEEGHVNSLSLAIETAAGTYTMEAFPVSPQVINSHNSHVNIK